MTEARPLGLMAFAAAAVFVAAAFARHAGGRKEPDLSDRALVVILTLAVAVALLVMTGGWGGPRLLWPFVGDVIFSALLVLLGVSLGREQLSPDVAVRRAIRAFALLCCLLIVTALAGVTPAWATAAVIAGLMAGALLIAGARHAAISTMVPHDQLTPAWRWLLAVAGVMALVVAGGLVLGAVLRTDVLLWVLASVGDLLRYLLLVVGYAVGWVGAEAIRGVTWLLHLVHLHAQPPHQPPEAQPAPRLVLRQAPAVGTRRTFVHVITVLGAALAVLLPLALVGLGLRRYRRRLPQEVVEEREAVASVRTLVGGAASRMGRRLRRLAPRRRAAPTTPEAIVRQRYLDLERHLARAGFDRRAGTTVRAFLNHTGTAAGTASETPAELAAIYELARYSGHTVDAPTATRFEAAATSFGAAAVRVPAASGEPTAPVSA